MNVENRMDHIGASLPTRCREQRLYMSILSWILNFSINNGYELFKQLKTEDTV